MSSSSVIDATGSIFQTERSIARPMSWVAISPLRRNRRVLHHRRRRLWRLSRPNHTSRLALTIGWEQDTVPRR